MVPFRYELRPLVLLAVTVVLTHCGGRPDGHQAPRSSVAALSQTASFSVTAIDASPPDAEHLEKAIGYFTSTSHPSYYLGTTSGGYVYDPATGGRITIDQDGYHYERARPFTYPGDQFAGIIASVSGQAVWYQNPANWNGGDASQPWRKQVVLNSWCHDIHLADFDGDGRQDVACSGTQTFDDENGNIAFQNDYDDWAPMTLFSPAGDGIAIFDFDGRPNVVGCSAPSLYWYENPGGRAARNPGSWTAHYIGDCTEGVSIATLDVGGREIVVQASNEGGSNGAEVWSSGLAYFDPGSNPYGGWNKVIVDSSYRDVHEIATDTLGGVPFITVGEQSQASSACNSAGYDSHPSVSGCRVAVFPWGGGGFDPPTLLANRGTQNQALIQLGGVEYMLGANHNAFGDYDKPLYVWTFSFASGDGGDLGPGTYSFQDSAGNSWDAGWSQSADWANQPYVFEYAYNGNPWQQFVWANGRLQIAASGSYLTSGGNLLGVGGNAATFAIVASGGGYTVKDTSSGLYVSSPGAYGPPNTMTFSSSPTVWSVVVR